jgi:hypothetical protein
MLEILSEDLKTKTKTTNTICKALVSITHLPCPLKKENRQKQTNAFFSHHSFGKVGV